MFTLPILDVKADTLDALLAALGFRLSSLIKNNTNEALTALQAQGMIQVEYGGLRVLDLQALRSSIV